MDTHVDSGADSQVTQPWNKSKLTGAKPPLSPKHVWAIRTRLLLLKRFRDLALFNLAIDSKLRGSNLVGLRIADVAAHGYAVDRAIGKAGSLRDYGANPTSDRRPSLASE